MVLVLISNGNSEIGAHVRSNLRFMICLRHWIRSRAVGVFFSPKRSIFSLACATCNELQSDISTLLVGRVTSKKFNFMDKFWWCTKERCGLTININCPYGVYLRGIYSTSIQLPHPLLFLCFITLSPSPLSLFFVPFSFLSAPFYKPYFTLKT